MRAEVGGERLPYLRPAGGVADRVDLELDVHEPDLGEEARAERDDLDVGLRLGDRVSEPLDLDRYGVPAGRQEETWRQVRTLGMLMGYLEEAIRRGDRTLMLRSAAMLPPAYEKLAAELGMR